MLNRSTLAILVLCFIIMVGCSSAPQHSNTLIFSTTTKVAIDISAEAASGSPEVTIGYKRVEGVWMPLLANEKVFKNNAIPTKCTPNEDCVFQSNETAKDGSSKTDTYSVLATLGAKFGGEAEAGSAAASGGISQFFATGLAAQKLAETGGSRLVSVQPTSAQEVEIQTQRAEIAEAKVSKMESELIAALGEKKYKETTTAAKDENKLRKAKVVIIMSAIAPNDTLDAAKWKTTLNNSNLSGIIEKAEKSKLEKCTSGACIETNFTKYLDLTEEHRQIIDKINKTIVNNS